MRWTWLRRRARAAAPPARTAGAWGVTAVPPATAGSVRLGFADGTEMVLDDASGASRALLQVAAALHGSAVQERA